MTFKLNRAGTDQAFRAASQRFPQHEFAIRRLMSQSEAFCDMCEELADAESALSMVPAAPPELHETRTLEWQEVVDRLVAEVATALREAARR